MPPENSQDPYGFITNSEERSSIRQINFGNTPQQRMIIVGAGMIILIIAFFFLFSLFSRSSNAQKDRLINLAQTQAEIIRVAELADDESSSLDTKALAINTKYTLQSDLEETKESLAKRGVEVEDKSLGLKRDESTDKALEEAAINNQFDEKFAETIQEQLEDYRTMVKEVYQGAADSEKQAVKQNYDDIALLL